MKHGISPALSRALALADDVEGFPLGQCGPSDDLDKQTAYLYGFRDIAKRFLAASKRIGDPDLSKLIVGLDASPEYITEAYDLKANLGGVIDCLRELSGRSDMNPVEELFELADAAAQLRTRIQAKALQGPLEALRRSSTNAARAWSGSNLGYHADVYYEDLQSKPPSVQFSAEWGLEERWPVHSPDPHWQIMDHEAVIDEIVSRAGGHDPKAIEDAELAPIREAFAGQKENAISILSAVLSVTSDAFLQNKLEEIEKLKAPDPSTIARRLVPNGQIFTRDTLALTQKLRIAPHQSVSAFPLSAGVTASAIDGLERAARLSASHLQRLEQGKQKASVTGMTIFIGHGKSPVWRELRDFLEKRLHLSVDEFNSVPVAGISTVIRLEEMLNAAAFAFVVMTAEDELPDGKLHARLNVVHEAGLFQGRLGFKKAIILLEEGCEEFSNIHGLGQIRFPKSGISAKFEEIRSVLEREGLAASPTASR